MWDENGGPLVDVVVGGGVGDGWRDRDRSRERDVPSKK